MDEEILQDIAEMFQKELIRQLNVARPSRTYSEIFQGKPKPVSGRYPTPFSRPKASGNLERQTKVYWEKDFEDGNPNLVVDFGDATYYKFIDEGRRPNSNVRTGQLRPALTQWARIKPLPRFRDEKGRFITNEERAFLITRSVAKYGYQGTDFINKAFNNILNDLEERAADAVAAYITRLFDEGRIFPRSDFNRP